MVKQFTFGQTAGWVAGQLLKLLPTWSSWSQRGLSRIGGPGKQLGGQHQWGLDSAGPHWVFAVMGSSWWPYSQQDLQDRHCLKLTQSGSYRSKSSYVAFFTGSIKLSPWKKIWKRRAPLCCKFFICLAFKNRCWTADCLAKGVCRTRMPAPSVTRKRRQSSPGPVNSCFFHSVGVVLDFAASELICCGSHYHRCPLLKLVEKSY